MSTVDSLLGDVLLDTEIAPWGPEYTSFPLSNKFVPAITVSLSFSCIAPSGPNKVRLPYPPPDSPGDYISSPFNEE
jgi:hypothetical protein